MTIDLTAARALAAAADKAATCIVSGDPLDTGEFATLTADDSRDMAATIRSLADEVERLRDFIADFAETKFDPLPKPPIRHPADEPDPVTDASLVWAWQDDARVAIKENPHG